MRNDFLRFFLLSFIVIAFPLASFGLECDVIATGAGDSSYNGTYVDTGSLYRGEPRFYNGSRYLGVNSVSYDSSLLYFMFAPDINMDSNAYYRTYASGYLGSFTTAGAGTNPAISTSEDCGSVPSDSGEMLVATSTVDVIGNTTNFALAIIITILSLFVIAYVYNQFSIRKRPWQK